LEDDAVISDVFATLIAFSFWDHVESASVLISGVPHQISQWRFGAIFLAHNCCPDARIAAFWIS